MTIHWLVQNTAAYPELARAECPHGLLNAAEQRHFESLFTPKRQREWLLGRLTAKQLVQSLIEQECGDCLAFDQLTILNAPNGAPIVSGTCFERAILSISHRAEYAFCAAALQDLAHVGEPWALGADIELVEPRLATFADDYFTHSERQLVARAHASMRETMITAIWSAKEAALKALHLGLNVDTHAVNCWIEPLQESPQVWTPFQIEWDPKRWDSIPPALTGWWRVQGDFVLTLAAMPDSGMQPNPAPIYLTGVFA